MKRFCHECGKEAREEDNVCIDCGTHLKRNEASEKRVNKTKTPMPKKQKLILQIVAGVIVFVIGFTFWANSYQSPEAVEKRFDEAVQKGNSKKISKLMVHEDGTQISKGEAEAFLELVKQAGKREVANFYYVAKHGKFLGIYDAHKMEVYDQFAYYEDMIDGLDITFNGEDMSEFDTDEEMIVYGPLAPGIYSIQVAYKGEYGETEQSEEFTLDSYDRDYTWLNIDIPVGKVSFYIENYEQLDTEKAYITLNEEKIPISAEGETEEFGPITLDGSQTAETVITMPWGEVVSEPFEIDASDMYVNMDLITPDQYEALTARVVDFGEQFVQAMAEKSTKPFKNVNDDLKESMGKNFDDDYFYTGKLNSVGIDKTSMAVNNNANEPEIVVPVQIQLEEDHHELSEKADLYEEFYALDMGLAFNKDKKEWTITSLEEVSSWGGFEATDEKKGSGKVHGPGDEAVANAKTKEVEKDLGDFIDNYTDASVDAINYRNFGYVEDYITEDGPRRKEASEYIDYLDSKDIYEDWYGSEVEKVEKIDGSTWKVTVIEEFEIRRPDSSDVKKFRTVLTIKKIDDDYYVDELNETNEV